MDGRKTLINSFISIVGTQSFESDDMTIVVVPDPSQLFSNSLIYRII